MLKEGYDKKLAAGVVAAGGTLASLIPPSAILIIYAIIVEESVGALLLAGFLPGIFSAIVYGGIIIIWAKLNPDLGPPGRRYSFSEKMKALPGIIPIAIVITVIISAIYAGWATPTEAGALGAILSGSGPTLMVFSEGKEFTIDYELKEAARKHNLDGKVTLTKASNEGIQIIKWVILFFKNMVAAH